MKRTTMNFGVDLTCFINLLLLTATGAILRWALPPGSGGGHGSGFRGGRAPAEVKDLLGLGRHDWGDVHFALAVLFVCLILVHLSLHWRWIKTCGRSILSPSRQPLCSGWQRHAEFADGLPPARESKRDKGSGKSRTSLRRWTSNL
jgi:hypothetical protein